MRRRFSAVRVRGLEGCRRAAAEAPLVFLANHTSWWDPLVAIVITHRVLGLDGYALMDAANLRARPYFSRVGAVGVELGSRRSGADAIRHCAALLERPGRALWIFPQGAEMPPETPLVFKPGALAVSRRAPVARSIPVSIRYHVGPHELPEVWVSIGTEVTEPRVEAQVKAVAEGLDRIRDALSNRDSLGEWANLFGASRASQGLGERALTILTRRLRSTPALRSGT